jgi:hypothetical protein
VGYYEKQMQEDLLQKLCKFWKIKGKEVTTYWNKLMG